ncbi:MAG: dihydroorotate dehydrogenase electron transfer subunit [Methanomassiliicoccaceae archaeon]|nr:dihydroorotate dehydrogenase electron transfer subunit [Methanomassiliicoccaceae archaeon]
MNEIARITACRPESHDTKTLDLDIEFKAKGGQFVMVWLPGVDEVPMSLSSVGRTKSITIKTVGCATNAFCALKEGDMIGVRGPYGNGFSIKKNEKVLAVAGGVGIASLIPVIRDTGADTIIGARTRKDVLMEDEIKEYSKNVWVSTDDGSYGFSGNAVQLMKEAVIRNVYDLVIGCGPEIMLYHLHKACVEAGVECQLSLERYMKCGAGLCGSCVMDGMRVCEDGPVFNTAQISKMKEFGKMKLDASGTRVKL